MSAEPEDGWDGKERRTEAPSTWLRTRYRWHAMVDHLAEERILLGVAVLAVFIILAVQAVGISAVNRRNEADGAKTRALINCVVASFQTSDRAVARAHLAECLKD